MRRRRECWDLVVEQLALLPSATLQLILEDRREKILQQRSVVRFDYNHPRTLEIIVRTQTLEAYGQLLKQLSELVNNSLFLGEVVMDDLVFKLVNPQHDVNLLLSKRFTVREFDSHDGHPYSHVSRLLVIAVAKILHV